MIFKHLHQHRAAIIILSLLFLIGFRGYYGLHVFSEYDDACYYRLAAAWVGVESGIPFHVHACAPGTGLAWAPILLISKLIAALSGASTDAWAQPLIGLSSFFFFALGSILLGKAIQNLMPRVFNASFWGVVFGVSTPILFFALHRTTMAHAFEYFVVALTLWLILKRRFEYALLAAAAATMIRYNDFPLLFVVLGAWADNRGLRIRLGAAAVAMASLTFLAAAYVLHRGYSGITFSVLGSLFSVRVIPEILWGGNFGLLWTAPLWVATLIGGTWRLGRLSNASRAVIFWMWALLVLQSMWGGFGSSFGYRYFIGSWLCIPLVVAELWGSALTARRAQAARKILAVNAAWITALYWIFQTTPGTSLWETATGNYDNTRLLWNTLKSLVNPVLLVRPLALSPLASTVYSWFLPQLEFTKKYVLAGPQLIVLSVASLAVVGILMIAVLGKGEQGARKIRSKERRA